MTFLNRLAIRGVQVAFAGALFALWSVASARLHSFLLPPPGAVWDELVVFVRTGEVWQPLGTTVFEHLTAFGSASVCGLLAGFLVSRTHASAQIFDPIFAAAYSIPSVLLLPLFLLLFGVGVGSKIALGFIVAFFPVVLSTISAFRDVDSALLKAARSMGASDSQVLRCVLLPAGLPLVLSGLRIGAITSLLAILGAEAIASLSGLGHAIVEQIEYLQTAKMFAIIAVTMCFAFLVNCVALIVDSWGRRRFA
jgi:NitT/TauT family transport system permease protein